MAKINCIALLTKVFISVAASDAIFIFSDLQIRQWAQKKD